jgi:hypothetical protein
MQSLQPAWLLVAVLLAVAAGIVGAMLLYQAVGG